MTVLSAVQVAGYWTGAGGPLRRAVEWVAIAMGESDFDDSVVSPAGAIGLWQIMPFNAAPYGYAVADLYRPAVNAYIAFRMSGGGTNCAAWDSAYLDIEASGRYTYLAWPEKGSADWNNLPIAQAELSGHVPPGMHRPPAPGVDGTLEATAARIQAMSAVQVPAVTRAAAAASRSIATVGRRGWRG